MRNKENLCKLMNINYLSLTNQTLCVGNYDLPTIYCHLDEIPDYIALYSQPCDYHKTENTIVSFYDYDIRFNGRNGLYSAIYYNDKKLLEKYKERFKGVKYFISPDFSMIGDGQFYHNLSNYGMSREVALWIILELGATVIPNVPCSSLKDLDYVTDGIESVNAVAFSTKGRSDNEEDRTLIKKSIDLVLQKLPNLEIVIVYDTSSSNGVVDDLFLPVIEKGIKVIVPNNSLKARNTIRSSTNV